MPTLSGADRAQLRSILSNVNDAQLSAQTAIRVYRNALVVAIIVLFIAAVAFPLGAAHVSSGIVVIHSTPPRASPSIDALIISMVGIEVWGLLGGLIAAAATLPRLHTSRSPAGLQLAQLVLKLPAGALTALFGIVLLQSGIIPSLSIIVNSRLAAYAVLFGFAQETLTLFIDRRAANLLQKAPLIEGRT